MTSPRSSGGSRYGVNKGERREAFERGQCLRRGFAESIGRVEKDAETIKETDSKYDATGSAFAERARSAS